MKTQSLTAEHGSIITWQGEIMAIMEIFSRLKKATANINVPAANAYWPLYQVYKQHQFIYVSFKDAEKPLQSMILSIDPQNGSMEIDEFFPKDASCVPGQRITVLVRGEEGRSMQFNTFVLGLQLEDGSVRYTVRLPEQIKNHQRREAFRMNVTVGGAGSRTVLNVSETDSSRRFLARIKDLSTSGVGLQIEGDTLDVIPVGSTVTSKIGLSGLSLDCRVDIRRSSVNDDLDPVTEIGGEFVGLSVVQQRELTRYIMESQRRQRRA